MALLPTMLFVPGGDEKAVFEALAVRVPAIIYDLEDSVPPGEKARARSLVASAIAQGSTTTRLHVRVNSLDGFEAYRDIVTIARAGLSGVVIPKLEHIWQARAVDWALSSIERDQGVAPNTWELTGTIESEAGVRNAAALAQSTRRMLRLCFGAGDFSVDMRLPSGRPGTPRPAVMEWAMATVALASRSAGLEPPHDGVYFVMDDPQGLRAETHRAVRLGFWGKHALTVTQAQGIMDSLRPTPEEMVFAERVLQEYEAAVAKGAGTVTVDGRFVNTTEAARARSLIERARALDGEVRGGRADTPGEGAEAGATEERE